MCRFQSAVSETIVDINATLLYSELTQEIDNTPLYWWQWLNAIWIVPLMLGIVFVFSWNRFLRHLIRM